MILNNNYNNNIIQQNKINFLIFKYVGLHIKVVLIRFLFRSNTTEDFLPGILLPILLNKFKFKLIKFKIH